MYTGDTEISEPFRYRLFLPVPSDETRTYPLILWLHGHGDRGDDNISQLLHINTTLYPDGSKAPSPFFILAPQCSRKLDLEWTTPLKPDTDEVCYDSTAEDMLTITMKILDDVQHKFPIDRRKIVVVGISSGASACWTLAARYRGRFAAMSLHGAGEADKTLITNIGRIPIWAFHATDDPKQSVLGVRSTIAALNAAGGNACLTETDDHEHNCWNTAFSEHDLKSWLLDQELESTSSLQPGQYRRSFELLIIWKRSWPWIVISATVLLLGAACRKASPLRLRGKGIQAI